MLHVPSFEAVRTLGSFLSDSGYDVAHLGNGMGLRDSLHANSDNLEALLYRTSGETALHLLARLFFAGLPVSIDVCRRAIPETILAGFLEAGALRPAGGQLEPQCILIPFGSLIAACDTAKAREGNLDIVVGPSLTTRLISGLTVRGSSRATLDLGTGSGVLALEAAAYSERVVATDINQRALPFVNFGAALNGLANLTAVSGDGFAAVPGQTFSRIVANPPFFLTPAKKLTHSDSPLVLDGFCRRLAKEAPQYLENGGYFQMICEWAQVSGQPWHERVQEWVADSDCDALILKGTESTPADYAEKRANEAVLMHGAGHSYSFTDRMNYFNRQNVESICGGAVIMRKRHGTNWVSIVTDVPGTEPAGDAIRRRFDALDFISSHEEASLLKTKFRLAPNAGLEQRRALTADGWQLASSRLVTSGPLEDRLNLDLVVANFIPLFDGEHRTGQIAASVAASLEISTADAERKCLQLVRRLLQGNFVDPV